MSKVIKSDQYIEAHPCRLEPVDVDAFFINNDFSKNKNLEEAASSEPTSEECGSGKEFVNSEEPVDLNRLADLAGKLGSIIGGVSEQAGTASTAGIPDEDMDSKETQKFLDIAQQEAQRIFSGAKNQAVELTSKAGKQADQILNESKQQADLTIDEARKQAERILDEARRQANLMVEDAQQNVSKNNSLLENSHTKLQELSDSAKLQAGSILDGAKKQAGDITFGANREAEQLIDDARQKADFAIEASNQKAAQTLEKARQQMEEILQNARQEAAGIIETAKKESGQIQQTANQQAAEIKKKAQQEGFDAGHQEGLTSVRKEFESKLATALSLLAVAEQERMNRILSSETELLKLAVSIAEKIIGAELRLNPEAQLEILKAAVSGIPTAGTISVKVNPDDYQFIFDNLPEIQKVLHDPIPMKVEKDQGIVSGNCYIETDHGNIDARIKSQLETVMNELLKMGGLE